MELKGMWTGSPDKANNPEGTWTENTRNIVISKDGKSVLNENGFAIYAYNYTEGVKPIGAIPLYNDEIILFSVGETPNTSEIGKVDSNGYYEAIIRDNLGFSQNRAITGDKQYNIYGELEIVYTDDYFPLSILNVDKLPFELNPDLSLADYSLLNNIYVFPEVNIPTINVEKVNTTGGSIETGTIYFSGRYEDYNGFLTNSFPISNPVLIIPVNTSDYSKISGEEQGTLTTNSVEVEYSNLDARFKKLHLIVVKKFGGQKYAYEFKTLIINGNGSLRTTYTGTENTINVSLSELLVDRADYKTAAIVKSNDGVLYAVAPSSHTPVNIQKYVNNWKVKYVTAGVNLNNMQDSLKDGKVFFSKKPHLHNEVYSIVATVRMKSGNYGGAFHIPGRAARPIQDITNPSNKLENELVSNLLTEAPYLSEDALINSNARYYQTRDTSSSDGTMGFWENQNETYANTEDWDIEDATGVIGTLRGERVRHHKTPTIDKHGYIDLPTQSAAIIGFKIEDIYLPEEVWEQIQDIEIFYVKRTAANSTLAGRSLLFFGAVRGGSSEMVGSNAGNWAIQPGGTPGSTKLIKFGGENIRMHAFDMLEDKTSVMPTYIYNNKKLSSNFHIEYSSVTGTIVASTNLRDSADVTITNVLPENKVRSLYDQRYFPQNTIIDEDYTNRYNEEVFHAKLKTADTTGDPLGIVITDIAMNMPTGSTQGTHQTYLTDLCVWKEDVYVDLSQQDLVSTGSVIKHGDTVVTDIFGGDGYYGRQGLILSSDNQNTESDTDEHDAIWAKYQFYVETANAPELQYGEFYPKFPNLVIPDETLNTKEFPINYNKDYTSINDLNVVTAYDFETPAITKFFNRILRSKKSQREEKVSSWRTFLANDYYEAARDRGRITNIEIINGEVLIQHEYGLFITRGSETFTTDTSTVEVGSGDVFSRPPREIVDSQNGYVGCSSMFGSIKGVGFYLACDDRQGRVFIMDDSLNEISNEGMQDWFRENFTLRRDRGDTGGMGSLNNPYKCNGIMAAHDTKNERIILSKRERYLSAYNEENGLPPVDLSLTISYSIKGKYWVAQHDYVPEGIVATANKLISFKDNQVYIHNAPGTKGDYYTPATFPAFIEMVATNIATRNYNSLNWKTQYRADGVIDESKTLTHVLVYNHNQCSGILPVIGKTTRNVEGVWKFNSFRDLIKDNQLPFLDEKGNVLTSNINLRKPFFKQARFVSDYLCVRLIFDNLELADLVISEFGINDRISYR